VDGIGRVPCSGQGWYGCGTDARASTDVTYWPKALRNGAILKTQARVREITVSADGRARGAVYYDSRGNLHPPGRPAGVTVATLTMSSCSAGNFRINHKTLNLRSPISHVGIISRSQFVSFAAAPTPYTAANGNLLFINRLLRSNKGAKCGVMRGIDN
jgi:GMC oxidoreductase